MVEQRSRSESKMSKYDTSFIFGRTIRNRSSDEAKSCIQFDPILSVQRYATVLDVIRDYSKKHTVKIITEFGSGSFQFFYRYAQTLDFLEILNEIDIDAERINSALHVVSSVRYRTHNNIRTSPLVVNVFRGNCADKDRRTIPSDVVIGIEIIEHLNSKDLNAFPRNVFDYIKPKLAVFTTPNYDFNVLFENDGKFRHNDHKFEFTKQEFQSWADQIVLEFPDYTYKIYGIGDPPNDIINNTFCSQMAVFTKIFDSSVEYSGVECENYLNYELIGSYT